MNLVDKFNKYLPETLNEKKYWEWKGATNRGYGIISHNKKTLKAHRVSYELYYAEPLNDLHCLHKCDNPSCVNPLHLFSGKNLDNVKDKINKGRCYTGHQKDADVIQIRELYNNQNHTTIKLGKMYGVHRATISYIVNNKTYTHLLEN